jgi:hypothetical protein
LYPFIFVAVAFFKFFQNIWYHLFKERLFYVVSQKFHLCCCDCRLVFFFCCQSCTTVQQDVLLMCCIFVVLFASGLSKVAELG